MFVVNVSAEQIAYAKYQSDHYNWSTRYDFNGAPEQVFTGVLGQTVVSDILNRPRPTGETGFDGGIDLRIFNKTADVKTMRRSVPTLKKYVNNFYALQDWSKTDLLIFTAYNYRINDITICGVIRKDLFLKTATFYPDGSLRQRDDGTTFVIVNGMYEMSNNDKHLTDVDDLDELIDALRRL